MTKAITKQETTAIATPSHAPLGFDDIDMDDLIIPRLRLLQALSEAVTSEKGKSGQFQNSLTEEVFDGPLEFIPLMFKNGAVYFQPGEGLKCKSVDGVTSINGDRCAECPFNEYWKKWKDDKPPQCAGTKEFTIAQRSTITDAAPNIMVLTFMKTSFGLGKKLISMARLTGQDLFANSYSLESIKTKNDKGTFFNFGLAKGNPLDQKEYDAAMHWYKTLNQMEVKVHEEPVKNNDDDDI